MTKRETYLLYDRESKWWGVRCDECKTKRSCDGMEVTKLSGGDTQNGLIQCEGCGIIIRYFTPSSHRN